MRVAGRTPHRNPIPIPDDWVPLAVQVAQLLGVPPETVMVDESSSGITVAIGELRQEGFIVTGDVPLVQQPLVEAWARRLLGPAPSP